MYIDFSPINMQDFYARKNESFSNELSIGEISNRELLILSIDLGDGRNKDLTVHENEDIELLAIEFCQLNMLGPRAKIAICEEIQKQIHSNDLSAKLESNKKKISVSSPSITKTKKINIGNLLYSKGINMKERLKVYSKKAKEKKFLEEMEEVTFSPKTNSPERRNRPAEDILLEKGRQSAEKLVKKRTEREISLTSSCTFSPEINKTSVNMKRSKIRSPDRFKFLYQDADTIKEKISRQSEKL